MNIREYESSLEGPTKEATITFLLTEKEILLAMKKRGFGMGKWNGVGGKPEGGEDIIATAIRESQEEIGVTPNEVCHVATIVFYHPFKENGLGFNLKVSIFISSNWTGEPEETEEMRPQWFEKEKIPYDQMWWDDAIWLPIILKGSKVRASFMFDLDEKIIDQIIEEVETL